MGIIKKPELNPTIFHNMVTVAPCMLDFFKLIQRVARTDVSVLIRGETGTGKELAARAIHNLSSRKKGPWQAVNCATLDSDLLASELFGHVKGAFTGAIADKKGLFELSNKSSLFLDEVGEMSLNVQSRLLRVLEERVFTPVGATQQRSTDVRIISATHRALRDEVDKGLFREDLMYRLRVVKLYLPPLRKRIGDVQTLLWCFISQFNQQGFREITGIEQDAYDALNSYLWPGNIRELRNAIESAFAIGEGETLLLQDLPPELRGEEEEEPFSLPRSISTSTSTLDEKQQIEHALNQSLGRKNKAAEMLGISRSTLWRKMREFGLN